MTIAPKSKNKKTWDDMSPKEKALGIILLVVIAFGAIGIIGVIFGSLNNSKTNTASKPNNEKSQLATAETKPKEQVATSQKPTAKPQTETQVSLATQVKTAYLKQIGYGSITELNLDKDDLVGSPENEITSFEDESSGVVKVNVQDSLTKTQAKQIGIDIMIGASGIKSLTWADVRGTNGMYTEVSRQDAGLAD